MIRIAICDDDKKITTQLEDVIEDYSKQLGIRYEINIFFDGKELIVLCLILSKLVVTAVLIIIQMRRRVGRLWLYL